MTFVVPGHDQGHSVCTLSVHLHAITPCAEGSTHGDASLPFCEAKFANEMSWCPLCL